MVSITTGYVIVDEKDDILLGTLASNRAASWDAFMMRCNYRVAFVDRKRAQAHGFKCVRVEIKTEEYTR